MIREIVKDEKALSIIARRATMEDKQIVTDLIDTATFLKDNCVGLAANQIGFNVRIIVIGNKGIYRPMLNPIIKSRSRHKTSSLEGCLSRVGEIEVERHDWVEVMYQEHTMGRFKTIKAAGIGARVIQHEMDHLNGILI